MSIRPRRSVLYVPGSNARAMEKARTLATDTIILDLEDAVAPERKEQARSAATAVVVQGGFGSREVVIRANALATPWGRADVQAACRAGPDVILFPKISSPEDAAMAVRAMREARAPERTRLWLMMETPGAVLDARDIAAAAGDPASRLEALVMGTNDLAKELHAKAVPGRAAILPHLATCVAAARAYGLDCIDGVFNDIADAAGFVAECRQARDFGFDGKTLIHPSQIAPCNEVFTPDAAEVAWARKIVCAFDAEENRGKSVLVIDGRMIERLHIEAARRTIALCAATSARA